MQRRRHQLRLLLRKMLRLPPPKTQRKQHLLQLNQPPLHQPKKAEPAKAAVPAAAPAEKPKAPVLKAVKPQRKSVSAAAATATGKVTKKNVLRGKGLKKKKVSLRFGIDCTNIAEDNIMDVADFVSTFVAYAQRNLPQFGKQHLSTKF
uniref:60S ribosomal protein L22 n=1 Tax=Bactrocera latifrons TaxID=174628 RepID=A0A0K8U9B9_BACLA